MVQMYQPLSCRACMRIGNQRSVFSAVRFPATAPG